MDKYLKGSVESVFRLELKDNGTLVIIREMDLIATTAQADSLYLIGGAGFLIGSWFFGRAISVITKGNNPLVLKRQKKEKE